MKLKRKTFSVLFLLAFTFSIGTFVCSCNSDAEIKGEALSMILESPDKSTIVALTKTDSILIDSIAKLNEFKAFVRTSQELNDKVQPLMDSWSKEISNELNSKRDSIIAFTAKLSNDKSVEVQWKAYMKSYESFMNLIENARLSNSVKTELMLRALRD